MNKSQIDLSWKADCKSTMKQSTCTFTQKIKQFFVATFALPETTQEAICKGTGKAWADKEQGQY